MITNNVDLIVAFDRDHLCTSIRVLAPTEAVAQEHAAQCVVVEILRAILQTGITLAEWNSTAEPWRFQGVDWDTWFAARHAEGFARAAENVSASVLLLSQAQRDTAAGLASSMFEQGYEALMARASETDKITFTRTGGV